MDNQGVNSLLTGLSDSLNKYMGVAVSAGMEQKKEAYKSQLDTQKVINEKKAANSLEDQLSPDMAEKVLPGYGSQMVNDYNKAHPDSPLKLKDGVSYLKQAADALNPETAPAAKQQDKLEKDYADRRSKVLSNRSGGLGLQDQKVNQAIDLRKAINQYYDPSTDTYKIPPSMHEELALGLARLMSTNGQVPVELIDKLKQGTAREKLANAAIFLGIADPEKIGGPTQDVAKLFVDTIDRQGQIAEQLRNHYEQGLKDLVPSGLEQKRADHVNKADITNSYTKELNSAPDYIKHKKAALDAHPVGKVLVTNKEGILGYIPANQLQEALKNGYKQ